MKLKDMLRGIIPEELRHMLPRSYDIVGEVAIIEIPEELREYARPIGECIMRVHKRVKSVYSVEGPTKDPYRVRPLRLIAGEDRDSTVHVEYGVRIHVYFKRAYINPSLGYEHYRVSRLVSDGERVLDMFSGVGGFTLHVASRSSSKVLAVDINPYAILSLKTSTRLNKLKGVVDAVCGDAKIVSSSLRPIFHRVIMNLPERSHLYIADACRVICEEGGYLHYYRFSGLYSTPVVELMKGVASSGRRVARIDGVRRVLEASPSKHLYVVDAYVV